MSVVNCAGSVHPPIRLRPLFPQREVPHLHAPLVRRRAGDVRLVLVGPGIGEAAYERRVQRLIEQHHLTADFADKLHPYVRKKFLELLTE